MEIGISVEKDGAERVDLSPKMDGWHLGRQRCLEWRHLALSYLSIFAELSRARSFATIFALYLGGSGVMDDQRKTIDSGNIGTLLITIRDAWRSPELPLWT